MTGLNIIQNKEVINNKPNTEVLDKSEEIKDECNSIIENPDYKLLANLYNDMVKDLGSNIKINYQSINYTDIKFFNIETYIENYKNIEEKVLNLIKEYLEDLLQDNYFYEEQMKIILKKCSNSLAEKTIKKLQNVIPEVGYLLKKFDNFKIVKKIDYVNNNSENIDIETNKYINEYLLAKKSYFKILTEIINIISNNNKLFDYNEIDKIKELEEIFELKMKILNNSEIIISEPFISYFLGLKKIRSLPKVILEYIDNILSVLMVDHSINNTNTNNYIIDKQERHISKNEDFFSLYIYQIDNFYNQDNIKNLKNTTLKSLIENKLDIKLNKDVKIEKLDLLIKSTIFDRLKKTDTCIEEKISLYLENEKVFLANNLEYKELIDYINTIDEQDKLSDIKLFFKSYFNKFYSKDLTLFVIKNNLIKGELIKNFEQIKYIYELSKKYNIDSNIVKSLNDVLIIQLQKIDNPEDQKDLENIINMIKQGKDVSIYFKNKTTISNFLNELNYLNSNANGYQEIYDFLDQDNILTKSPLELKNDIDSISKKYQINNSIERNKQILLNKNPEVFTEVLNFLYIKFNKLIIKKDHNNKERNKVIKNIFSKYNENDILFLQNVLSKINDSKLNSYDILNNYITKIINNKHRIYLDKVENINFEKLLKNIDIFGDNLKTDLEIYYGKENYDFIRNKNEDERIKLRGVGKYLEKTGETDEFLLYLDSGDINYNSLNKIIKLYSLFNILDINLYIEDFLDKELSEDNINYIWENINSIDFSKKEINKLYILKFCNKSEDIKVNNYIKELLNIDNNQDITILPTTFHNRYLLKKDTLVLNNLKRINSVQCIKKIEKLGFKFKNANGSHYKFHKGNRTVIIPFHSEELDIGMLKSIIVSTGIETIEEWNEL